MIAIISRRLLFCSMLLTVMASMATVAPAQELTYNVEHEHGIGSGKGELRITEAGIEYRGESENEARHSHIWHNEEIKRLEVSKTQLRIIIYEAARIPIIPRKVPFSHGGKSARVGSEHEYVFRLRDGEITADVVRTLLARFPRPIATTVIPNEIEGSDNLLFEIPVFHRHRAGGESGILRVYKQHILFDAEVEGHSRYWRYSDIRDISRVGNNKFEIATYEGQFGTDGKSYIFDLKRPMTDGEYDSLWTRLYEREHELGPAPKQDK